MKKITKIHKIWKEVTKTLMLKPNELKRKGRNFKRESKVFGNRIKIQRKGSLAKKRGYITSTWQRYMLIAAVPPIPSLISATLNPTCAYSTPRRERK
jgi:hypothetical protein